MTEALRKRIVHYRKAAGYTQENLAELLGMKPSTYSQKEKHGTIDCELAVIMADLFKVDIFAILFEESEAEKRRKAYEKTVVIEKLVPETKPQIDVTVTVDQRTLTIREKNHLDVLQRLNNKEKTTVFQYAYDIFNGKIKI